MSPIRTCLPFYNYHCQFVYCCGIEDMLCYAWMFYGYKDAKKKLVLQAIKKKPRVMLWVHHKSCQNTYVGSYDNLSEMVYYLLMPLLLLPIDFSSCWELQLRLIVHPVASFKNWKIHNVIVSAETYNGSQLTHNFFLFPTSHQLQSS